MALATQVVALDLRLQHHPQAPPPSLNQNLCVHKVSGGWRDTKCEEQGCGQQYRLPSPTHPSLLSEDRMFYEASRKPKWYRAKK